MKMGAHDTMTGKKKEAYWLILLLCLIAVLVIILLWPSSESEESTPSETSLTQESRLNSEDSRQEQSSQPEENSKQEEISRHEETSQSAENSRQEESSAPPVVSDDWNLILVNRKHPLPEGFTVATKAINDSHAVDERIADALDRMLSDARAEGLAPVVCSSFRTWDGQTRLFNNEYQDWISQGYSESEAYRLTAQSTAIPGTSEHQTGLAVDIVSNYNWSLTEEQEKTEEQQWLMAHCAEYGFILRFPNNKTEYTGIIYEPWHYRYVGVELAQYLTSNGLCLEEYLDPGTTIDPYTGE